MLRANWIIFGSAIALAIAAGAPAAESVTWSPSIIAAQETASVQNKLVLVHFWAPDCAPCRKLEQAVFSRPGVGALINEFFVPVKVNARTLPATALKYSVDRWPSDVLITPRGQMVHKMVSPQDPRQYIAQLSAAAYRAGPSDTTTAAANLWPPLDRTAQNGGFLGGHTGQPGATAQTYANSAGASTMTAANMTTQPPPATPPQNDQLAAANPTGPGTPAEVYNQYVTQHTPSPQSGQSGRAGGGSVTPSPVTHQQQPPVTADPGTALAGSAAPAEALAPPTASSAQHDGRGSRWSQGGESQQPAPPTQTTLSQQSPPPPTQEPPAGGRSHVPPVGSPPPTRSQITAADVNVTKPPLSETTATSNPPLGMDGYCAVTLLEKSKWQKGDPRWGAIHRGRTFLFATQQEQQQFLADPDRFSPVLSGVDAVQFADSRQVVPGSRKHGVVYKDQVYLFSSEENLERFWSAPEKYAGTVRQATQPNSDGRVLR